MKLTITDKAKTEGCSSCQHSYAFIEVIPSPQFGIYKEKWACLFCKHERTLTIDLGANLGSKT